MRSNLFRAFQNLFVSTRFYVLVIPFLGSINRIFHLTNFAIWKNKSLVKLNGYNDRFKLYKKTIEVEKLDHIYYLEFGVSKGESLRWWSANISNKNARFFGFDTFEGIPEDWGAKKKGSYTNNGNIPLIDDARCSMQVGLFQNTLHAFLVKQSLDEKLVIHLDADLYSSTLFCLFSLGPFLKKDDILIFDEFDITTHEFRAFIDFMSAYSHLTYTIIGESNNFNKVVLKIN